MGPLEAIHQAKARVDCRGSKTDLALKQGDSLDIIRVQGNPEGKWLGRTQDGSSGFKSSLLPFFNLETRTETTISFEFTIMRHEISLCLRFLPPTVGYVKTTSVEIDFNTLKNCSTQQLSEPEVYDDIDVAPPDHRY